MFGAATQNPTIIPSMTGNATGSAVVDARSSMARIESAIAKANAQFQTMPAPPVYIKNGRFSRTRNASKTDTRHIGISAPIMSSGSAGGQPFAQVATIDLTQAMEVDRRDREVARQRLIATNLTTRASIASVSLQQMNSAKRKPTPSDSLSTSFTVPASSSRLSTVIASTSSSLKLTPNHDTLRRRSPDTSAFSDPARSQFEPTKERRSPVQSTTQSRHANRSTLDLIESTLDGLEVSKRTVPPITTIEQDAATKSVKSPGSMLNRPRPNTRQKNADRPIFPSEASPGRKHARNRSGSSDNSKKSVHNSLQQRSEKTPPLPSRPTSAKSLVRLLTRDAKSMTLDEKLEYLFPAPPGIAPIADRRSSVPSIPSIPLCFESETAGANKTMDDKLRRSSKRSTVDFSAEHRYSGSTPTQSLRVKELNRKTLQTEARTSAGATSNWASLHSPVNAINLAEAQRVARSTYIQMRKQQGHVVSAKQLPDVPVSGEISYENETADVSEMLDAHTDFHFSIQAGPGSRNSLYLEVGGPNEDAPPIPQRSPNRVSAWHNRIGQELPAFSERRKLSRKSGRTMPPPIPLLLRTSSKYSSAAYYSATPSPESSPHRALKELQDRLRYLDDLEPVAPTVGNKNGFAVSKEQSFGSNEERADLLEDLETEMGLQQERWLSMRNDLGRDSPYGPNSAVKVNYNKPLPALVSGHSRPSSLESLPQKRTSGKAVGNLDISSESPVPLSKFSTYHAPRHDATRATIWKRKLAQAQELYLSMTSASTTRRESMSLFASTLNSIHDCHAEPDPRSNSQFTSQHMQEKCDSANVSHQSATSVELLWQPKLSRNIGSDARLWAAPTVSRIQSSYFIPTLRLYRPRKRRQPALEIQSTWLWFKPAQTQHPSRHHEDLWSAGKSITVPVRRPTTLKPLRKPRRISNLADIGEYAYALPYTSC